MYITDIHDDDFEIAIKVSNKNFGIRNNYDKNYITQNMSIELEKCKI